MNGIEIIPINSSSMNIWDFASSGVKYNQGSGSATTNQIIERRTSNLTRFFFFVSNTVSHWMDIKLIWDHFTDSPPSVAKIAPVIHEESSDAK
jgi:hypothetical protein